jgi:signal transduction histidine kinase
MNRTFPPPDPIDRRLDALPVGHRVGDELLADPAIAARLVQAIRTALLFVAPSGEVRAANRAFHVLFGTVPDAVLGHDWRSLADGGLTRGPLGARIAALLAAPDGVFEGEEAVLALPQRGERWVLVDGVDAPAERGGERLVLLVFEDVTEVRAVRVAAEAWRTELERSNRELEQFASVAAHDLQEPVRKILAFGERLKGALRMSTDDEVQRNLERVLSAAERARTLIGGVLALSRASTRPLQIETVSLDAVLADVAADLEGQCERTGGTIDVGPLPTLRGDPVLLRQLFQNLVSNGLKFHREGAPPHVTVRARRAETGAAWLIEVRDDGIGFEARFAEKLFQPFTRLNPRGAYEGVGIGLALCHRIAVRHDGHIVAASVPGGGATFVVTLPFRFEDPS